jgi:hypothetical protein
MTWSWPGPPALGYALTTAGMILFWTLVIFGAILLMHRLGRESPVAAPAAEQPGPASRPPAADPAPNVQILIPTKTITPIASAPTTDETSGPDLVAARGDVLDLLQRTRRT